MHHVAGKLSAFVFILLNLVQLTSTSATRLNHSWHWNWIINFFSGDQIFIFWRTTKKCYSLVHLGFFKLSYLLLCLCRMNIVFDFWLNTQCATVHSIRHNRPPSMCNAWWGIACWLAGDEDPVYHVRIIP